MKEVVIFGAGIVTGVLIKNILFLIEMYDFWKHR